MLGTNAGSVDLVKYARANGAYVLVADYLPPERSEAKQFADEALLVSTAETETLVNLVNERHIDCVYSGISEFNLLQAMAVANKCNLPFYCTKEQWDTIEIKSNFRRLCDQHQVPAPKTWYVGDSVEDALASIVQFPVVVKPVDGSASTGVFKCFDQDEFTTKAPESKRLSKSGLIIVEELVVGYEFTAHYTIHRGKASLSCIDNRYPVAVHEGAVTTIPAGRIYPSLFIDEFVKAVNPSMVELCESIGLENAVIFIQGLYNPETQRFAVFEAGLRGAGECPNRFIKRTVGIDYAEMLLDSMLAPQALSQDWPDDPYLAGKSCGCVSFVTRHGVVGSIDGLQQTLQALPDIVDHEVRYPVGSETPDTDTLRQLAIRFFLLCDNREKMAEDVAYINSHVSMVDTNGQSMTISLDPERLFGLE